LSLFITREARQTFDVGDPTSIIYTARRQLRWPEWVCTSNWQIYGSIAVIIFIVCPQQQQQQQAATSEALYYSSLSPLPHGLAMTSVGCSVNK